MKTHATKGGRPATEGQASGGSHSSRSGASKSDAAVAGTVEESVVVGPRSNPQATSADSVTKLMELVLEDDRDDAVTAARSDDGDIPKDEGEPLLGTGLVP